MKKITLFLFLIIGIQGFSQFTEGFEAGIPANWTVINGGDTNTWVSGLTIPIAGVTTHSGTKVARIDYTDFAHDDYLITKQFLVTSNVSNRISVWGRQLIAGTNETFDVLVSTTGVLPANFTNVLATNVTPTAAWTINSYSLNAFMGQNIYVAFRCTTTNQYQLYLDDISVDGIPSGLPSCAQMLVAMPNASCGNLKTVLSWAIDPNATGYKLSVGTTAGATDIINNQNIGYVGTFDITNQIAATTYYWTVTPYNLNGSATNCPNFSYDTYFASCYCSPNPTAVDGYGITNVTIGAINNTTQIDPGNYGNFSVLSTNAAQGTSIPFSIKMQTGGYAYNMNIWIDWNDDYDFLDTNENAFVGLSTTAATNYVVGSIAIPSAAIIGSHRMRISGQFTSPTTPCFSGAFACFEDYTLNVTPNLGTTTFGNSKFSYYPNPVKDILNLKSNTEISNIEVYNLLGQKVIIKVINTSQIDMSNVASGTYLIKFESDKKQENLKVIKQ